MNFRENLRKLYHGRTPAAVRFQYSVIAIDLAIIAFFIVTPILQEWAFFLWLDYSIAALLVIDMTARALASSKILRWFRQPTVWIDLFVLLTLLLPSSLANLGFLRIMRLWTMSRREVIWRPLQERGLGRWRDPGRAVINLVTFLFIMTGFIYTLFFRHKEGLDGYVEALYFTVTTVTTTGFGDITLPGVWGRLISIMMMIFGISLFIRVAQSVFRPPKVYFACPQCALQRHDPDAVYCKSCGYRLQIPDDGGWAA
jgi:voltage-gated potassium channel